MSRMHRVVEKSKFYLPLTDPTRGGISVDLFTGCETCAQLKFSPKRKHVRSRVLHLENVVIHLPWTLPFLEGQLSIRAM